MLHRLLAPRAYSQSAQSVRHPYFVPRNSRGSLPVYTDIRNGGTRYLILLKNVQGDVHALSKDIAASLFGSDSVETRHLKIDVPRNDTIVITGGRWRNHLVEWLRQRGF